MKHIVMNPQVVPVVKVDKDLPALPEEMLTADFLRASFKHPPRHWEAVPNERPLMMERAIRKAAVLLPLVDMGTSGFSVLLMQRSMNLQEHPGQISLPGGKVEENDLNLVATALRETHEEIGVAPKQVDVLGMMPAYTSLSAFEITPVVGLIQEIESLTLSTHEVVSTFTVPLAFLMNPAEHRWHSYQSQTDSGDVVTRQWLSMEYVQEDQSYFIWGITAAIIRNFYLYLRACG